MSVTSSSLSMDIPSSALEPSGTPVTHKTTEQTSISPKILEIALPIGAVVIIVIIIIIILICVIRKVCIIQAVMKAVVQLASKKLCTLSNQFFFLLADSSDIM